MKHRRSHRSCVLQGDVDEKAGESVLLRNAHQSRGGHSSSEYYSDQESTRLAAVEVRMGHGTVRLEGLAEVCACHEAVPGAETFESAEMGHVGAYPVSRIHHFEKDRGSSGIVPTDGAHPVP